jgi:cytidylate kinase
MPFTTELVREVASRIGLDFEDADFTIEDLAKGMEVELEHGSRDSRTNVTGDDPVVTAKIAWAHLLELPDYYDRLDEMEKAAESGAETFERQVDRLARQVADMTTLIADTQLNTWTARIEDLELRASLARMELRDEAMPMIEDMKGRLETARTQLASAGDRAGDVWVILSEGLRTAFEDLKTAFEDTKELVTR